MKNRGEKQGNDADHVTSSHIVDQNEIGLIELILFYFEQTFINRKKEEMSCVLKSKPRIRFFFLY
jgi:hypothetical protein